MRSTAPARKTVRRIRVAGLLVVAAIALAGGARLLASPSTTASIAALRDGAAASIGASGTHRRLGEADGAVPDGTSVLADDVPGVVNLDPALLGALRRAAASAASDGIELDVDSGWRSPAYQEQLRREAVSTYGSAAEAARWVATADTSAHVSGDAVDIGPAAAAAWLSGNGAAFGLCRVYGNEPWHFERRPQAVTQGCPPTYADPTHDPRMRR